ncbi:MAG: TIM-barrel domain-containing protein [Myxococcota bacterium]
MLLLAACSPTVSVGDFAVTRADDGLTVTAPDGRTLVRELRFAAGTGGPTLEMQTGAYRVTDDDTAWSAVTLRKPVGRNPVWSFPAEDAAGELVGEVEIADLGGGVLAVVADLGADRARWDAACTGDDRFAGLGSHVDVDHAGEAFPLWVSEPGIGKVDSDEPPDDWWLTGTKHATSWPQPFLLRPEPLALWIDTAARVDVDLCTGDRWRLDVGEPVAAFVLYAAASPMDAVRANATRFGAPAIPPDWALAPWNDAVKGSARVREVAATLRSAGVPASAIWTEDWKGAQETAWGYHLLPEWELDTTLYPDAAELDAELEALGFKWLAYFSPFLVEGSGAWEEAADYAIRDADGEPLLFTGVTFEPTTVLDLTREDARGWAQEKMEAALDVGFDGWMADYAEWLPPDAVLAGADALADHNAYPLWWQGTNAEVLADRDATFFTRSGWSGSAAVSPVHWPGDQRTSFDGDDGLATVVPLLVGAGIAGAAASGSDVAGYQSIGNDPSDKELWFRWCTLGAMSPVMRTHHGAFADDNWQFDSDEETLAHYARWAQIHARLFPYLRGALEEAASDGTPVVRAPFLVYEDEPWDRTDAYLLGPSLFVAPVTEEGATSREVDLPASVDWYDFWTGATAASGTFTADVDAIPVFAPAGAIVPMLAEAPDTFLTGEHDGIVTLADADGARIVRVFAGEGGRFVEADGTTYVTDGEATASATTTATLQSGDLSAGGLTLRVDGPVSRAYTLEVIAP